MHFTLRTSFRCIEDVEYIPKFGYRNLLNPIFFYIIVLKDPKGTLRDVSYNARWFWTTIRYGPMTTAYLYWTTGNGF